MMYDKAVRLAGFGLMLAAAGAAAQAAYPDRQPIKVVIPYAPGAAGDVVFRILQPELTRELGQTLVADYKTGAGGNIGALNVARAEPDGYTLLLGATNNFVINQYLYKNLGFDPLKDLKPIGKLVDVPAFIFINAQLPVKTYAEFRDYAAAHPGAINYGTPGAGTTPDLSGWLVSDAVKGKMVGINYRGSGPGVQALLGNEVQMYIGGYGIATSFLPTGKIRALAVSAEQRFKDLPDVPTTRELGIAEAVVNNWWALAAPGGTPDEVVQTVDKAVQKVLAQDDVRKKLLELGFVVTPGNAGQFAAELQKEAPYWKAVIERANIRIEQ